jgi:hypothetical protein
VKGVKKAVAGGDQDPSNVDNCLVDEILEDVKDLSNQEFDRKKTLEGKANNITTIAGTVATLLFGFGQFLVGKLIDLNYSHDIIFNFISILILGVAGCVIAIIFSVLAFSVQHYDIVAGNRRVEERTMTTNTMSELGMLKDSNQGDKKTNYKQKSIKEYKIAIPKNAKKNDSKSFRVKISQWAFIFSTIAIVAVLIYLIALPSPPVPIKSGSPTTGTHNLINSSKSVTKISTGKPPLSAYLGRNSLEIVHNNHDKYNV